MMDPRDPSKPAGANPAGVTAPAGQPASVPPAAPGGAASPGSSPSAAPASPPSPGLPGSPPTPAQLAQQAAAQQQQAQRNAEQARWENIREAYMERARQLIEDQKVAWRLVDAPKDFDADDEAALTITDGPKKGPETGYYSDGKGNMFHLKEWQDEKGFKDGSLEVTFRKSGGGFLASVGPAMRQMAEQGLRVITYEVQTQSHSGALGKSKGMEKKIRAFLDNAEELAQEVGTEGKLGKSVYDYLFRTGQDKLIEEFKERELKIQALAKAKQEELEKENPKKVPDEVEPAVGDELEPVVGDELTASPAAAGPAAAPSDVIGGVKDAEDIGLEIKGVEDIELKMDVLGKNMDDTSALVTQQKKLGSASEHTEQVLGNKEGTLDLTSDIHQKAIAQFDERLDKLQDGQTQLEQYIALCAREEWKDVPPAQQEALHEQAVTLRDALQEEQKDLLQRLQVIQGVKTVVGASKETVYKETDELQKAIKAIKAPSDDTLDKIAENIEAQKRAGMAPKK